MAKQPLVFVPDEWSLCPICLGKFKSHNRYPLKASGYQLCAWCYGRGGKGMILLVSLARQLGNRPCETYFMPVSQEALDCKCVPCTARRIHAYREKLAGDQIAPIVT